jgi:hypothetical protein
MVEIIRTPSHETARFESFLARHFAGFGFSSGTVFLRSEGLE